MIQKIQALGLILAEHMHLQEWLSFALLISVGFIATWIANRGLDLYVRGLLRRLDQTLADSIVATIRRPFRMVVFIYFLIWGLDQFQGIPPGVAHRIHSLYPVVISLALFLLAYRLVDIVTHVISRHLTQQGTTALDDRWANLLGYIGKGIVFVFGGLMVMNSVGLNIWPWLTGAGFFGAALALASQSTLANAIGSLELMLDRICKEGDRISFGEYDGFVARMGLRSIVLTSMTGEAINLPNKDLVDKQIRNYSKDGLVQTTLVVGITYDNDRGGIENALKILEEICAAHPRIKRQQAQFRNLGDSALELAVGFGAAYKTGAEYSQMMSELRLAVKEKFDAAGLEFAFPTRTIYVKGEGAAAVGKA